MQRAEKAIFVSNQKDKLKRKQNKQTFSFMDKKDYSAFSHNIKSMR